MEILMDELEKAMQNENFTLIDNHDKPSIVLYGRQCIGNQSKDGEIVNIYQFCIAQTWRDEKDFSMHHIHSYDNLKLWLNQNTTGGYKYYLELFKSR